MVTLLPVCVFAVERRRRDKINNWIVTLSKIIPDCSLDSRTGAVSASASGPGSGGKGGKARRCEMTALCSVLFISARL